MGVKPRLAITDRRTNTIPPLSLSLSGRPFHLQIYILPGMLAGNGRSKLLDLNKMATKLREHWIYRRGAPIPARRGARVCIDTGERTRAREYLVAILHRSPTILRNLYFSLSLPCVARMCAAHTSPRATPPGQFSRGKVNVCGTPAAEARNISFREIARFVSRVLTTSFGRRIGTDGALRLLVERNWKRKFSRCARLG